MSIMGRMLYGLQVCNVRNAVISRLLPISNFMEHTLYDCGHL